MAVVVTYQFYKDVYGGGLSEAAFGLALPAASRHVRWLVSGAEPSEDELESLDSYMMKYRKYGIVELFDNKLDGVYVSASTS